MAATPQQTYLTIPTGNIAATRNMAFQVMLFTSDINDRIEGKIVVQVDCGKNARAL